LFHDDIIPKADQTLRASLSAYEVGKTDFLQLIDNWRQLLRFQIMYQRLESQLRQTLATLDRVVGGELPLETPEGTNTARGPRPRAAGESAPMPPAPGKPQPARP